MPFETDVTGWTGEGEFTQQLLEHLRAIPSVRFVRVENAPSTRSDADYNFISNELFVGFTTTGQREAIKRFGVLPGSRVIAVKTMTLSGLQIALAGIAEVGEPDYADEGMLQYLRTERVIPPYQTRGYKMVELVRIYEVGTPRRS
jgi:hypothetical protein